MLWGPPQQSWRAGALLCGLHMLWLHEGENKGLQTRSWWRSDTSVLGAMNDYSRRGLGQPPGDWTSGQEQRPSCSCPEALGWTAEQELELLCPTPQHHPRTKP